MRNLRYLFPSILYIRPKIWSCSATSITINSVPISQATNSSAEDQEEVSTQQIVSYSLQRHSSSNTGAKLSAVAADQRKVSAVGQATISSVPKDEQLAEDTRRKSTQMVVTNVKRISGSELGIEQVLPSSDE